MILAGIDIGTNTLRLLVADIGPDFFREIHADRRITRLGQGLDRSGSLSDEARERSLRALSDFAVAARRCGALQTAAVGTSAFRTAANASSFLGDVKNRTGLEIRVIPGEEEARLMLLGVARALRGAEGWRSGPGIQTALVVDIGGGSTEIIATVPGPAPVVASLPLGAVYLTERFIRHDPPTEEELSLLRQAIRTALEREGGTLPFDRGGRCVGTAGTITTLAAVDLGLTRYEPARINGHVLTRDCIERMVRKFGALTLEARRRVPGLEPGREDIVLAGALVALEIMERGGCASMLVSDGGLREGIVLDLYGKVMNAR